MLTNLSTQLDQLLATEVDRREFLAYAGAALLGVFGISNLIKTLTQAPLSKTTHSSPGGYGSSTYGGKS